MVWLMEILKIYLEETPLTNYYMIKCLILLKIQNMINTNADLLPQLFTTVYNFFNKKSASHKGAAIDSDVISENQKLVEDLHKPVIRNLKNIKYTDPLKAAFGWLI